MRTATRGGTFTENGRRYLITLEAELAPAQLRATGQTINHGPISPDALEFAVSGLVWHATRGGSQDRRYADIVSGGQCLDDLRRIKSPRAQHAADLWQRWHLNGMRAACAHQTESLDPCPVSGYRYGSAWLYEPIPADVLADLRATFELAED